MACERGRFALYPMVVNRPSWLRISSGTTRLARAISTPARKPTAGRTVSRARAPGGSGIISVERHAVIYPTRRPTRPRRPERDQHDAAEIIRHFEATFIDVGCPEREVRPIGRRLVWLSCSTQQRALGRLAKIRADDVAEPADELWLARVTMKM